MLIDNRQLLFILIMYFNVFVAGHFNEIFQMWNLLRIYTERSFNGILDEMLNVGYV